MRTIARVAATVAVTTTLLSGCTPDAPTSAAAVPDAIDFARSAATCGNVRMTAQLQFTGPTTAIAFLEGDLEGYANVQVLEIVARSRQGQGAIHVLAFDEFVTDRGTFYVAERITAAPVDPPLYRANGRMTILGGDRITGGFIHLHGTVNFATGTGEFWMHGRICE